MIFHILKIRRAGSDRIDQTDRGCNFLIGAAVRHTGFYNHKLVCGWFDTKMPVHLQITGSRQRIANQNIIFSNAQPCRPTQISFQSGIDRTFLNKMTIRIQP